MKSPWMTFVLSFLSLFWYACSSEEEGLEQELADTETSPQTFGIRHDQPLSAYEGLASNPTTTMPDFTAVVAFQYSLDGSDAADYTASGTLIAPSWILTAAHNFYDAEEQTAPAPVGGIQVFVGNDPNNPEATYGVAEVLLHPTWLDDQQDYEAANDVCLVRLATPITNITPAKLYLDDTIALGAQVWFCGFGDYSQTAGQNADLDSKKHAVENIVDRHKADFTTTLGTTIYPGGLIAFDFDDPQGTINALGDDTRNADEQLLGAGSSTAMALDFEGTTVQGDSGGPLFIKNGTDWEIIGVLMGGATAPITGHVDGSYGDISIFLSVAQAQDWIQGVMVQE
ncbi:MAG: trypsin-like serine protease [Bacteroidota bacterium]